MKFAVTNLGCKVNAYECECIAALLEQKGYIRTEMNPDADIYVIFTCAVTNTAAQKSRQVIHRARRMNPKAVLAVAGCYAQIDPDALLDTDILVGSADKTKIPDYIEKYLIDKRPIRNIALKESLVFEPMKMDCFEKQTRAYMKIQDGCNQFCSYCIIPYARGRERSMEPQAVIAEAARLSEHHKEIVLTGIHTGRYGREFHVSLAEIMKRILKECSKLERLRVSSIEITEVDDDLIRSMKDDERIARHLHIPVQSGQNAVLKRMNRPYKTEDYYDRIEWIRQQLPGISISTDLIVGFPQETDEEFQETCQFLKKCHFSFLHVFPYSMRKGTVAAGLPGQIEPKVKKERTSSCMKISTELYDIYKNSWIGHDVKVLFETEKDGYSIGHSSEYLPVMVKGSQGKGSIKAVRLTEIKDHQLYGEAVSDYESTGTF